MQRLSPSRADRSHQDGGGIVLGWLLKLTLVVGAVGIVAFDGISIATARVSVEDHARVVARDASSELQRTGDPQSAYVVAASTALDANPDNFVPAESFVASPDGTVTVHIRRTADTIVLSRIGWIADWADVEGSATVRNVP